MGCKMIITADIVPTSTNKTYFDNGDISHLIGESLINRFSEAAFVAMNLEVPLTDTSSPIRKCGPCLIAPTSTINGLHAINPYFFTLANNHILDQGKQGLFSTMDVLRENGIAYAGVGNNLDEARRAFVQEISGVKVGIYCCAEHEYSIATDTLAGANPYDPLESFDDVRRLRHLCDYLIVLYHGGKEHYRYPSPLLQKSFRKFADSGADLVVAQHTHCIGCKEEYQGSTLVYGQGNFLFDNSDSEFWKTALIIEIDLKTKEITYIPLVKKNETVREADEEAARAILNDFEYRSGQIMQKDFIEEEFIRFADKMDADYLLRFSGKNSKNLFVRVLNKLTSYRFIKSIYPDQYRVIIENVLDCEAHRELASQIMRGR